MPAILTEEIQLRLICHIFLERLPREALRDVWESVYDAWELHVQPSLPPTPFIAAAEQTIIRKVFDPVEEAPFNVVED